MRSLTNAIPGHCSITRTCLVVFLLMQTSALAQEEYPVLVNGVEPGYMDLGRGVNGKGLDSEEKDAKYNWVKNGDGYLILDYPGGTGWAAVFFTVGRPPREPSPDRGFEDLSRYSWLLVEMKGRTGEECVKIGIKDHDDGEAEEEVVEIPEDKNEKMSTEWKWYSIDLSKLKKRGSGSLDMKRIYVVTEFVFPCKFPRHKSQVIFVRNAKFSIAPK